MDKAITAFRGQWAKLGNYSPCLVFFDGHAYNSVEHAYQAAKTEIEDLRRRVRYQPTAAQAKQLARTLPLRADWESVKVPIMEQLLRDKFMGEPERSVLLSTGNAELIEGNWWGDIFWGQCPVGDGQNWLGRLLMKIRGELRG